MGAKKSTILIVDDDPSARDRTELRTRIRTIIRINRYQQLIEERANLQRANKELAQAYDETLIDDGELTHIRANKSRWQLVFLPWWMYGMPCAPAVLIEMPGQRKRYALTSVSKQVFISTHR